MGNDIIKTPYDKLYDYISHHDKRFLNIYDLGTGRINWKLNVKIIEKELSFKFHLLENSKTVLSIPLCIDSNDQVLILKSKTWSDCIKIELFDELCGFLTYEGQKPIKIKIA